MARAFETSEPILRAPTRPDLLILIQKGPMGVRRSQLNHG